jgi:hypothetical protein
VKPKDFESDDGYWVFDDQKLYLLNGSMMNRSWLIVTELMKRREDLTDDFLWPFRKKLERALSIPQVVMDLVKEEQKSPMDRMLEKNGIRRLRDGEEEQKN